MQPGDETSEETAEELEENGSEGIVVEVETGEEVATEASRIAELEAQVKDHYERLLRTTADFDNFRKRSRRELAEARIDEQGRVLREMLPVIDNLERAIAAAIDGTEVSSIRQGVELVLRQFAGSLERFGVARVNAEGQSFDPNLHEAVSQLETTEHPPGTVVSVLQPGYTISGRLLRAALTVVAKSPAEPAPPEAPAGDATLADDDDDDPSEIAISEETRDESEEP